MNASDLTFGIEIETTMPSEAPISLGHYHNGIQVEWLPEGWNAQSDGSIQASGGRRPVEFVSPVLKGAEGVAQVVSAVEKIKAMGGEVNSSTGLHVHVGWNGDDKTLARLVSLVANCETAIYATTGTKNREQGTWCQGVRRHGAVNRAQTAASCSRYHVLNLTNLSNGNGKRTVEFRAFAGTLNVVKVIGYIRLCLALVELAHKAARTPEWTPKPVKATNSCARKGTGQTAVARMFYQLGWVKGRVKHTFGDVTSERAPSLKEIRRELMRLAKKYDQAGR